MKEDKIIRKMTLVALISCLFLMLVQLESSPKSPYPMTITRVEHIVQPIRRVVGGKPKGSTSVTQQYTHSKNTSKGTVVQESSVNKTQNQTTTISEGSSPNRVFPMNIHEADKQALMEVKGIGEKRAEQILEYLQRNGPIEDMQQLDEIDGIGEVLLGNLSEKFYVDSPEKS